MSRMPRSRRWSGEAGLTLVELLTVVVIVTVLAAIAIPRLSRDQNKADFEKLVNQLVGDLQEARFQAVANKDWREIQIVTNPGTPRYMVNSVDPNTAVTATLRTQFLPANGQVAGYLSGAKDNGINVPMASVNTQIRFSMTNAVSMSGATMAGCPGSGAVCAAPTFCDCSVTIFLQSNDTKHRARLVVYLSTGYTRRVEGW
jgi:prepilin-type N-terminal cleavage/methylation domain-containing protein